ncbi:MAG: FAD-dependent oxidoreductase [Bdellovibrionales bacterium]|nr:FAD-dependent oxidoreductase [Bdellovibrionales bacterium]
MARVVVLGAGVSGHTAASFLRRWLPQQHEVVVVSPLSTYNWIPSNIWVGVGRMQRSQVVFPLRPIYEGVGITFYQAKATSIHPEGGRDSTTPFVVIERTDDGHEGEEEQIAYDYLINATGPKLNFSVTEGLGPHGGHSWSVCTPEHATEAARAFAESIERMKRGEKQVFLVGTGHGTCTCQGAAFEYIVNLEFELRRHKVRDKADVVWISNEYELGDFGMGGLHLKQGGYIMHSKAFTESLFAERGIMWIKRAHTASVAPDRVHYERLDGTFGEEEFDFAMLLPPFRGVGIEAYNKEGAAITEKLFMPNGFMKVDADYSKKGYEEWRASDWPKTYQNPDYDTVYSVGIAFAPPHAISRPTASPNGTPISPAPPRTGMPSATMAKVVARNIADRIIGKQCPPHTASMADMGAACVASGGAGLLDGSAAAIIVYPIIPDFDRYPQYGRDINKTFGEIGLAGHWIKNLLHHVFMYKAKMKPGWFMLPE